MTRDPYEEAVLSIVWEYGTATSDQVADLIDIDYGYTLDGLEQRLSDMTERGLLQKTDDGYCRLTAGQIVLEFFTSDFRGANHIPFADIQAKVDSRRAVDDHNTQAVLDRWVARGNLVQEPDGTYTDSAVYRTHK